MKALEEGQTSRVVFGVSPGGGLGAAPGEVRIMGDPFFLVLGVGFFTLAIGYIVGCERLMGRSR